MSQILTLILVLLTAPKTAPADDVNQILQEADKAVHAAAMLSKREAVSWLIRDTEMTKIELKTLNRPQVIPQ